MRNDTDGEKLLVGAMWQWRGGGEYEQFVVDAWMMVAICGLKCIRFCQNESNQTVLDNQNYMAEVSRLLVT